MEVKFMSKEKVIRKAQRMIAVFIALLMYMTVLATIPAMAEIGVSVFNYDDYVIEYSVVNEWDSYQNIEIKLTNTGSEPIYNWALKYDAGGEISNLWNGTIFENVGTNYIIKNNSYNYEVTAGESISFGYTLNGNDLTVPDSIENCADRVEITNGCYIQLVTEDMWENGFTGYIEILNESEEPFEAWMLSFDTNFVITNFWNAAAIEISEYSYKVSSIIASNAIQSGDSVKIGISGTYDTDVIPKLTNKIFTAVKIDDNFTADNNKNNDDNNIHDDSDELVGKIYFKDISSTDDFIYDSEGNCYFKNQILLTAYDNVSFETVADLADSLNAEIVGYIELTNDYQIEFKSDMSVDELLNYVEMLSSNSIFELVTPNIISDVSYDNSSIIEEPFPNDEKIQPLSANKNTKITNNNANLYAINAYDAWRSYSSISSDAKKAVKIGIIDEGFDDKHEDLHFAKLWNTPINLNSDHGTCVSGIIGATFNNKKGIAGICPETELYAYDFNANAQYNDDIKDLLPTQLMHIKYVLALMIGNNIKVINVSLSIKGSNDLEIGTRSVEHMLNKLLDKGYDFIIVNSAGNCSDPNSEDIKNAKANSYFNNIDKGTPAYDHIIVVGAVDHLTEYIGDAFVSKKDSDGNMTLEYMYRKNSKYDGRVDIVAPGEGIYTTSIERDGYTFFSDTSAAAPQVAGVAGLIYSVNPNLKGNEVKRIVLGSANKSADLNNPNSENKRKITYNGYTYALLDAKAALDMALEMDNNNSPNDKNEAIVFGTITNKDDEPVDNAYIYVMSKSTNRMTPFKADDDGNYLITLTPDTYDIYYVNADVIGTLMDWTMDWFLDLNPNEMYLFHKIKNKKIEFGEAYPLDVTLDNNSDNIKYIYFNDSYGNALSIVQLEITNLSNNDTYNTTVNSSSYGYTDREDGKYIVTISKSGYFSQTLKLIVKNGIFYDEIGNVIEKIVLEPEPKSKSTITGAVLMYNADSYDVFPKINHTVSILQDGTVIGTAVTDSKGIYEVEIEAVGEVIVKFDEDKQETVYANGDKYTVNACYIINGDDDDDNNSGGGDGDGNGGGDNDDGKVQLGLPGIIYDYWGGDEREDRFYTIYYCSSITITKPYPDNYQVYGVYNKIVSKGRSWDEERITIYEPATSISYLTPYPDGHWEHSNGSHTIVVGGTCFPDRRFPYDTTAGFMPLPEEVMEKLMAGEMVIFFVDENAPDGQPLQYAVVEHEYN